MCEMSELGCGMCGGKNEKAFFTFKVTVKSNFLLLTVLFYLQFLSTAACAGAAYANRQEPPQPPLGLSGLGLDVPHLPGCCLAAMCYVLCTCTCMCYVWVQRSFKRNAARRGPCARGGQGDSRE